MRKLSRSCFIIFSLVGGVLLVAAFSLIPYPAFAASNVLNSADTNDTNTQFIFSVNLQQGCLTKFVGSNDAPLEVLNGSFIENGHTSACNWRLSSNGDLSYYNTSQTSAFRRTYVGGSLTSSDNNIITQGDHSTIDSFPPFYQTIKALKVYPGRSVGSSYTYIYPNTQFTDSRFIGHFSFNLPDNTNISQWVSGFQPGFDKSSVRLQNLSNNSYLHETDSDKYYQYMSDISRSTYFVCGDSFDSTRWINSIDSSNFSSTATVCSIFFSLPNVPNYRYEFSDGFNFSADISSIETLPGDSFVSTYGLSVEDVSYLFRNNIAAGRTNPSSRNGTFMWSNNMIQIVQCSSQIECDYFNNLTENYRSSRSQTWENPNATPNDSIFESWFNIFDFSILFPFRNIFGMFSDDTCVEIPVIAGMLNTGSTYCTWWSPSVRSILTPVFTTFSLMLITGFVFSWLTNGHAFTIDGSLARNTKNKSKGGT